MSKHFPLYNGLCTMCMRNGYQESVQQTNSFCFTSTKIKQTPKQSLKRIPLL